MNLFYKNKGNEASNPNSSHNSQQVQVLPNKNSPSLNSNVKPKLKKNNYMNECIVPEKSLIDQIFENANEIYENEINNFTKNIIFGKIHDQENWKPDDDNHISNSQCNFIKYIDFYIKFNFF